MAQVTLVLSKTSNDNAAWDAFIVTLIGLLRRAELTHALEWVVGGDARFTIDPADRGTFDRLHDGLAVQPHHTVLAA